MHRYIRVYMYICSGAPNIHRDEIYGEVLENIQKISTLEVGVSED